MGVGDLEPLIPAWTPGAIAAEQSRIRGILDAVNMSMSTAAKTGKISAAEWQSWFDDVYTPGHKLVDVDITSGPTYLWGGANLTDAKKYEQAALQAGTLVRARGGRTVELAGFLPSLPKLPVPTNTQMAIGVGLLALYFLFKDGL